MVKLASGDPEWRNFTAMDEYYQNGPLPTWIGWYVQHLPHWFHAFATGATLVLELGLVFMLFLPRRWRIVCFFIVTAWQIPVILTANYTFLNYLVLLLGFLLLDDRFIAKFLPDGWKRKLFPEATVTPAPASPPVEPADETTPPPAPEYIPARAPNPFAALKLALASVMLLWIFYTTTVQLVWMFLPHLPLPTSPVAALEPFRIANRYGLFAVMTRGRYEIEFQGSDDGQTWIAYPFRYKPQDSQPGAAHLRALSAALRLELVVCVAGLVAGEHDRPQHRGAPAGVVAGCAGAVCRQSLPASAAQTGAGRAVAVLVHHDGREARHRHVVAAQVAGTLCASAGDRSGRQSGRGGDTRAAAAAPVVRFQSGS